MSDSEAKTQPPTARKLQRLRRDGMIAQCPDAAAFIGLAAGMAGLAFLAPSAFAELSAVFDIVARASVEEPFENALGSVTDALASLMLGLLLPIAALIAVVASVVLLIYAGGPLFAIKAVLPEMERISPGAGFRRLFGFRSWIDLLQSTIRMIVWLAIAAGCLALGVRWLTGIYNCQERCAADIALQSVLLMFAAMVGVLLVSAIADMLIQRRVYQREQRMTETELKRERAEQSGLPEIRKERKRVQKGQLSGAGAIGLDKVTLCFYWQNTCIGLHYHPTRSPLPRVAAAARQADSARAMRDALTRLGVRQKEHQRIVEACARHELGAPIDEAIFMDVALAMKEMLK